MTEAEIRPRTVCREIMTSAVKTATPETSLRDAALLMRESDVGCLPVLEGDKLVGIVTDRDIVVRAVAEGLSPSTAVSNAMTRDVVSVKPDDYVFNAIRTMGSRQIRRLPVVDERGALVGIIAMADIALEMEDEREIAETLEDISTGSSFWSKPQI